MTWPVRMLTPHRAGMAREAADVAADGRGRRGQRLHATRDVVALAIEGPHRAGLEARCSVAAGAQVRRRPRAGNGARNFRKRDGEAVAVPQAVHRMQAKPDRRCGKILGTPRPAQKRPMRRTTEGEQRNAAAPTGHVIRDAVAPAVERVG